MRLFAAIPVEGEGRTELQGVLSRLAALDWPVKWVRPEHLHLTVKFLGEVESARVAEVSDALGRASAGVRALTFGLRDLGAYPSVPRARVLWAALEAESALELMVDQVERNCQRLGFPIEGRPFHPHVTIGRVRDQGRLPKEAADRLAAEELGGNFVADRLVLYHSRLGPGGPHYEPLETFTLGS